MTKRKPGMTKDEYIEWKATRGPGPAQWNARHCHAADALIKRVTMENVSAWTKQHIDDLPTAMLFRELVRAHFGTAEIDGWLTAKKLYPEWM